MIVNASRSSDEANRSGGIELVDQMRQVPRLLHIPKY